MVSPASRGAPSAPATSGWLVVVMVVLVVAGMATAWLHYFSASNVIEVDQGIRITLPDGWKKVRNGTLSGMPIHFYRGEPAEKVGLSVMIRRNAPQEIRTKVYQHEALMAMVTAIVDKDQPLPVVIDLSHDDVVHVQATIDDHAILEKPSAQLGVDDFKHMCMGTIIRNGDFIHYEIAYDDQNPACKTVIQSMDTLAWGR